MKKLFAVLLSFMMIASLAACSSGDAPAKDEEGGNTVVEELNIAFVPSKDPEEILAAAAPLENLLKTELLERGFEVGTIEITVGNNYEVVGEGLASGSIDLGFLPAGNYVISHDAYPEDVNLLLVSSRAAVSVDIESPSKGADWKDWNDVIVTDADQPAAGYRSLIYVNVGTEKGADLYKKACEDALTWEDIKTAKVAAASVTSSAGFKYPSAWLNENFADEAGKTLTFADVDNCTNVSTGYKDMMYALLNGSADISFGYADVRKDAASTESLQALQAEGYYTEYETIFDLVKVIGVSEMIMNDTISYGSDEKLTPEFLTAIQEAFLEIIETEEGKACVKPYSHTGYVTGTDEQYDGVRAVNALFAE